MQILEAKESLAGQQEMFDQQDDEGDENMMDVDVDADSDDSDVEVVEADSGEDSDNDSSDNDNDSTASGEDPEVAIFEAKLAAALGTHRGDEDLNAADDSGSDSDMTDSAMEQLDNQLVKVFQARRDANNHKKDKKDARGNMVNFKNRVLDLLDIYVKKCHAKVLALDLLLPLLRLTRRSSVKQVADKAAAVVREFAKLCKGAAAVPRVDDLEPVWELLRSVHAEAGHSGPPAHAAAASQASLLLVKVVAASDRGALGGVVDVYGETRKNQLLSRKSHVQPSFFTDWNNWCVSASKQKE